MRGISVFDTEVIHTKREFCWERFVAPDARVITKRIKAMGIGKFYKTVKSNASC